jgi:hypothetical protein
MSSIRAPKPCDLYSAGHNPHWIQIFKGANDLADPPQWGRLLNVSSDGLVCFEVGGQVKQIWNHDPLRLIEAAALSSGRIRYQKRWRLLFAGGSYAFCANTLPYEHVPCKVRRAI